jgi:hypothetical protein
MLGSLTRLTRPDKFWDSRTGGRVVEGTSLENWHTGNGIVSSNLTPSVW